MYVRDRRRCAALRNTVLQLHMEPGRFLVSQAGALLVHVTQVRTKGAFRFVGVSTGMNSLIRCAPLSNPGRLVVSHTVAVQARSV